MAKRYILTPVEYRKKRRNEERLEKLKTIINEASQITRQIKRVSTSKKKTLKT